MERLVRVNDTITNAGIYPCRNDTWACREYILRDCKLLTTQAALGTVGAVGIRGFTDVSRACSDTKARGK